MLHGSLHVYRSLAQLLKYGAQLINAHVSKYQELTIGALPENGKIVFPEVTKLSMSRLMAVPMYMQHGFVAICMVSALSTSAGLQFMASQEYWTLEALCETVGLMPGYTRSCLHLLVSLNYLFEQPAGTYGKRPDFDDLLSLPLNEISKCLDIDFATMYETDDTRLFSLINVDGPKLARTKLLLESFYLAPIMIYLRMHVHGTSDVFADPTLDVEGSSIGLCALNIFRSLGWCADNSSNLTYRGRYIVASALNAGVPISYYPMFSKLSDVLAGDGSIFAQQEADGHEVHVDRVLNVVASGAQHRRFFEHMCDGLSKIFDVDIEQQPKAVADMGCGDGRLLLTLYEYVRDHTRRGRQLDKHPLTLIGIDFNDESLEVTKSTLSKHEVPFIVQWGDIGDPASVSAALEERGFAKGAILHVRSFLDHDRPYIAPK